MDNCMAKKVVASLFCFVTFQIQTKDGFLLGLQRVSSSSLGLGYDGERGPPVLLLLLHGLFMVTSSFYSS